MFEQPPGVTVLPNLVVVRVTSEGAIASWERHLPIAPSCLAYTSISSDW